MELGCWSVWVAQLGVGTTRNEQLHRELKSWMRNIYQTHEDRLQTGLRVFLFAKLLTHSSAAYSPTLKQCSQQRLLSIIAGKLRPAQFFHNHLFSLQIHYQWR